MSLEIPWPSNVCNTTTQGMNSCSWFLCTRSHTRQLRRQLRQTLSWVVLWTGKSAILALLQLKYSPPLRLLWLLLFNLFLKKNTTAFDDDDRLHRDRHLLGLSSSLSYSCLRCRLDHSSSRSESERKLESEDVTYKKFTVIHRFDSCSFGLFFPRRPSSFGDRTSLTPDSSFTCQEHLFKSTAPQNVSEANFS